MKLLFAIFALLVTLTASAQTPVRMKTTTVGALPTAADAKDMVYRVNDALTVTDCTSGGGSIKVQCQSDGSTWSAVTANLAPSSRQVATSSPLSGGGDMSADRTVVCATCATTTNGGALSGTAPIAVSAGGAISIPNAAADGSTKGAASFTAADFDASSGNISIDYATGQAATGSVKGFLTAADWTTFNAKASQQTYVFFATTTAPACTNGGGTTTFLGPSGAGSATETSVIRYVVPLAGTVKNLRVWLGGNVPASETAAIKVVLGGSAQTNPNCSIAAGFAVCNDTSNTLAVVAGDTLNVQINCSGGTSALNARASVSFTIQ